MSDVAVANKSLPGWRPAPEQVTTKTVKSPYNGRGR